MNCPVVILSIALFCFRWGIAAETYTADTVLPQIGQRGTTVTVTIEGIGIDTAEDVLFYQPGIKCTAIRQLAEVVESRTGGKRAVEPGKAISVDFEIAPDAAPGEYYLRLRTKQKLSEMLRFWVTPWPVVNEINPYADRDGARNDRWENAQKIPINSTVCGYGSTNEAANDLDLYQVTLNKGQRCTCQILNARLGTVHGGGLTDMSIEVRSPTGKRVGRNSRSALFAHDPIVSFRAPEAGEYIVTVKQQMDTEGFGFHYALHIGDFARPVITYPLGGQFGEELDLDVFYEDGSRETLKATLPDKVGQFEKSMVPITYVTDLPEFPSPNSIQVAAFPNVMEAEGDDIQVIEQALPFAINGIIKQEGEKDWYRFRAKKGQRYRVRTYAMTLGSKLDAFLWIKPAEGTKSRINIEEDDSVWDGHDWEGHHYRHQVKDRLDPIVMFEPDVDGDYLLGIADTRRESGEDYIYRVEIQPHVDSVFAYYHDYPSLSAIVRDVIGIHRGSSMARPIAIQNGLGSQYSGPIRWEARGLPEGITFESPVFTKNDPVVQTVFYTSVDTPLGSGLFELVPHAVGDGSALIGAFAQTHASNAQRGDYSPMFNKTRKIAYGVLEQAPFDISIKQPAIGLAKNAELALEVKLTRKGDFEGAVYLESTWLPQGVTKQPPMIIKEGEDTGYYKISATQQASDGQHKMTITARENEGGNPRSGVGYHYVSAPLITIEIQDPYLQIELSRSAVERGTSGEIVGTIKHLRPFEGTATARMLRLPNGVSLLKEPKIQAGDETVVFPIKVEPDAITGQYKELACDIEITDAGQKIHQQTGDGVLRIDTQRK